MSSKGVSPVVATVLLMGIAIASVSSAAVFISGTMDDLQSNVEEWLRGEDRKQASELSVDYAYNGTGGYLLVDLRNTGSRSLKVEEDNQKTLTMYIGGVPEEWNYSDGSGFVSGEDVVLNPTSVLTVNTTEKFPSDGDTAEIDFAGPYEVEAGYVCYSESGSCER